MASGNSNQFIGGVRAPTSIVNGSSSGGVSFTSVNVSVANAKATLSGALTANTLKSILTVTGSGVLAMCFANPVDVTSRTIRIQINIDGVTVFDGTSSALTASDSINLAVGYLASKNSSAAYHVAPTAVPFNSSLDIKIASSLSETDKVQLNTYHWTT